MTLEEFNTEQSEVFKKVTLLREKYPNIRQGQALFIIYRDLHPDLCKAIVGTTDDCFYFDGNIESFLMELRSHLVDK